MVNENSMRPKIAKPVVNESGEQLCNALVADLKGIAHEVRSVRTARESGDPGWEWHRTISFAMRGNATNSVCFVWSDAHVTTMVAFISGCSPQT